MFTHKTPRVVAARRLTTASGRAEAGRFLVEGAQAVAAAIRWARVHELFVTDEAAARHAELVERASECHARVCSVTERAAGLLSETVSPQGIAAVCDTVDVTFEEALRGAPRLVAVLLGVSDPGNAGTVLRVADAAGADAVVFAGDAVDVHNGKCVRASTGSLFHLPVVRERDVLAALDMCGRAGLSVVAADGRARDPLDGATLSGPTAWLFGNEAHGLPEGIRRAADREVRVPIYGKAESLNLATAAGICLYASAMGETSAPTGPPPADVSEGDDAAGTAIN